MMGESELCQLCGYPQESLKHLYFCESRENKKEE